MKTHTPPFEPLIGRNHFSPKSFLAQLSESYGTDIAKSRRTKQKTARMIFYAVCKVNRIQLAETGFFVGLNHASVYNGLFRFHQLFQIDKSFREEVRTHAGMYYGEIETWVNGKKFNRIN